MMTGDLSHDVEEQLVKKPEAIQAAVLKAGHHGSRYSNAQVFLQAVKPDLVVFSVGKKNRYGHPHPTVLDRLNRLGIPFLRTDEVGDIVLVSAGDGKWVRK
jgi:competence protein ComEC